METCNLNRILDQKKKKINKKLALTSIFSEAMPYKARYFPCISLHQTHTIAYMTRN